MPGDSEVLGRALQQLLSAPVILELGTADAALVDHLQSEGSSQGLLLRSFADVLSHPNPSIELLQSTKRFAKQSRNDPAGALPKKVSTVLYYLVIAVALFRYDHCITDLDREVLRAGFQWVMEQDWVDGTSRSMVREGLKRLSDRSF